MATHHGAQPATAPEAKSHRSARVRLLLGVLLGESALVVCLLVWLLWLRGWLIPVALVLGVVIAVVIFVWVTRLVAGFFRRGAKYSLRSLMVVILSANVILAASVFLVNRESQRAATQRSAVERLSALGGQCGYQLRRGVSSAPAQALGVAFGALGDRTGLEYLGSVASVNLANKRVTDGDLAVLSDLPDLRYLDLSGTQITDRGLRYLRDLDRLEQLSLSATRVTDDGLRDLQELRAIQIISIRNTAVTAEGARALRKALPPHYIRIDQ